MRLRVAAVAAALVLTACGGNDPSPVASDSPTPSATTKKPRPKRSRPPTPKATLTPTATTPPPVTGSPVGTAEAILHLVEPGEAKGGDQCAALVPDMTEAACTALKTAGGNLIAVTGRTGSRKTIRLLVQTPQGYVARYEGRDPARSWRSTRIYAAALAGHGTDGVVFFVRLLDGAASYDVLTWVEGGPLVLRAHRGPVADGRLAPRDGALDEYEATVDGAFVKRRLAWDGRRFLLSSGERSTTPPPR